MARAVFRGATRVLLDSHPWWRAVALGAPHMHDGCATSLEERFDPACGGIQRGDLAGIDDATRADLVAYLQSL